MDRQTRHDIKHDRFLDELSHAYSFAAENRTKLILGTALIAVLALVAAGFVIYRSSQEDDAQARLADAIEMMSAPVGAAATGTEDLSYDTVEDQTAAARPVFEEIVDEYGSSDAADIARLYLAGMDFRAGQDDQARDELGRFVDDHEGEYLAGAAAWSLYNNRLASGDTAGVIDELQKQVDDPKTTALPTPALLALLARAYEMNGDDASAKTYWQRIANEYNDSPFSLEANRKLVQG